MHRLLLVCALLLLPLQAQTLRDLAERRGIRIGSAAAPAHLTEQSYAETLAREFNQVEPENAAKFGPIHPALATYNFAALDAIVAFAQAHKMAVRGHTLVWHNQNPAWLTGGHYTPGQLSDILHEHIRNVVQHCAGAIYAWDVVNEAFNSDGSLRHTIWSDSPGIGLAGTGYIEQALRWAHESDPKALLFYNDFGAEAMNAKSDAIYKMAAAFRQRGVPIDGIGMQMHFTTSPPPMDSVEANMKRIAALGLKIHITELDVRVPLVAGAASDSALHEQARIYGEVVALCLRIPACSAIQTWGFTDKYSWIPRQYPGMGAALEFDAGYQPKAAYRAIEADLKAP